MNVETRGIGECKLARGKVQPRSGIKLSTAQPGGQFSDGQFGRLPEAVALHEVRIQFFGFQFPEFRRPSQPIWLRVCPPRPRRDEIGWSAGGGGEAAGDPRVAWAGRSG